MKQADDIPIGYCQCGCGQKTRIAPLTHKRQGSVKGQPNRYLPHHKGRLNEHRRHVLDPETGCLIWQGCVSEGYGRYTSGAYAHRVAYEKRYGPVPAGMHVHHICRTPLCCNPDHLEVLTRSAHTRRHLKEFRYSPRKFSDETIDAVLYLAKAGWERNAISRAYGISTRHIGTLAKQKGLDADPPPRGRRPNTGRAGVRTAAF